MLEEPVSENNSQLSVTPRKPGIAIMSGILFPGLGQVYNGQPLKGFLFLATAFLIPFIFCHTIGMGQFPLLVLLLVIDVSFRIFILVDAGRQAKRLKEYQLKKYNKWIHYLLYIAFTLFFSTFIDFEILTGYRTFSITSTGNIPTMQIGDRVVADMNAYTNKQPEYGDLVAFMHNDEYRTYRVAGLPGDKIKVDSGFLFINGKICPAVFRKKSREEIALQTTADIEEWKEKMPNGHSHLFHRYINPFLQGNTDTAVTVLSAGNYYLVGDNRDNATDSRYIGPVRIEDIAGKILYTYWGETTDRINIDFRDK